MKNKEYRKLHAEWYEYMSAASDNVQPEIDFWVRNIRSAGEPVLELGSGTGKLLVPLMERGYDITGIDTSPDMMTRCRDAAQAKGLEPKLFEQSMLEFRLSSRFSLVMLPSGSLGLFTEDSDIRRMFSRVLEHLNPGGIFIYGFQPVRLKPPENNNNWTGGSVNGPDGILIAWRSQRHYDVRTNVWSHLFIIEKFVDGRLVETEANERKGRYFRIDEALAHATEAGMEVLSVTEDFSDKPAGPDSREIMVKCRKNA